LITRIILVVIGQAFLEHLGPAVERLTRRWDGDVRFAIPRCVVCRLTTRNILYILLVVAAANTIVVLSMALPQSDHGWLPSPFCSLGMLGVPRKDCPQTPIFSRASLLSPTVSLHRASGGRVRRPVRSTGRILTSKLVSGGPPNSAFWPPSEVLLSGSVGA
jgi:hypothetical protein